MYKVIVVMVDGTKKEFYSDGHFDTDGEIVYWHKHGDTDDLICIPSLQIHSFEEFDWETK